MRILHFYKNSLPESIGGVEQVIDQIAQGTQALGVENSVLALSSKSSDYPLSFHGYELFTAKRNFELASSGFSWESINLFKKLASKADLIHYHFPWPFADLLHRIISPKKPSVLTYHSDIVRQKFLLYLYRPLKFQFLKSVDHIVATSPNYLKTSPVLQHFQEKTSVIPIGLDIDTYPIPDPIAVSHYKKCFGERFFLFIGAFRYYKGLSFLIEAATISPYPIVIVGAGPIESKLRADVSNRKLKNIFFVGQVSDKNKSSLLKASYAVIFPSHLRSEAFGVTLLEGAMFGKPLISCEIGTGTTYINIHHLTGLAIPPSDPVALSDAMTWLWNHHDKALEMGESANSRYEELFTAKKMAHAYVELYQKVLNS